MDNTGDNSSTITTLDEAEEAVIVAVSDDALEAAAGTESGPYTNGSWVCC